MGADVMRWMYCEQVPSQNLNFGYGPAHEIKRRLLTFWNCAKFFVDYANVSPAGEAGDLEPLDRWLLSRTEQLVAEATDAYERYWTPDVVASFEGFVDDLSNWYIRRSRRRFWNGDAAALATLRAALMRSLVVIAPAMPFLSEHLWRVLRSDDQPGSVFLVRWQDAGERDQQLLDEVAETRRVVELGHQAAATRASSSGSRCAAHTSAARTARLRTPASSATSSTSRRSSSTTARSSARSSSPTFRCSGRGSARGCRP